MRRRPLLDTRYLGWIYYHFKQVEKSCLKKSSNWNSAITQIQRFNSPNNVLHVIVALRSQSHFQSKRKNIWWLVSILGISHYSREDFAFWIMQVHGLMFRKSQVGIKLRNFWIKELFQVTYTHVKANFKSQRKHLTCHWNHSWKSLYIRGL